MDISVFLITARNRSPLRHEVFTRYPAVCHDRTLVDLVYDAKARKMALAVSLFCGLANDVRTLYLNRDPELLELIQSVEAVEKMVSENLKKVA